LRGRKGLTAALSGITAAVVGVILNLAVWFSLHVLFAEVGEVRRAGVRLFVPEWSTLDVPALLITLGAAAALFGAKWGMMRTLLLAAGAGLAYRMLL
jgi:chromate transporter